MLILNDLIITIMGLSMYIAHEISGSLSSLLFVYIHKYSGKKNYVTRWEVGDWDWIVFPIT